MFLDFVNDPAKVLEDFQLYYKSASLPDNVDPSTLFEVADDLDAAGIYTEADMDAVAEIYFKIKDAIGAVNDNDQPAVVFGSFLPNTLRARCALSRRVSTWGFVSRRLVYLISSTSRIAL